MLARHEVLTPASPYTRVLAKANGEAMSWRRKLVFFALETSSVSYWVGGLAFLLGSFFFYPRAGSAPGDSWVGAYCYLLGCLAFLCGSCIDSYEARIEHVDGPPGLLRFAPVAASGCNVLGSVQFVVGGVYYLPNYFAIAPTYGSWLFISGCLTFCSAIAVDVARLATYSHASSTPVRRRWSQILSPWYLVSLLNLVGNIFFIVGAYSYLPQFVACQDADVARVNLAFAASQFIVGSVCFSIAPLVQMYAIDEDLSSPSVLFLQL
ncbi:hypothetical protein SDRG_15849 [Saprolegnia diclina VS20]|uniref:YrhK domain-containing protein n=1 Tax=Saprolegnia diclina (strain VS20) TaxID=1156394 RepID=T0PLU8_SAPDV|nr:hypothetical protein SDRG_15849 [Saprolegnia diclina VS20]EQC26364.1 hypothetical protein SDRG_15849 [Saprolegnia diclina VS20]|eukprot:XP_008620257.1 hypothetical protein SDRG_15849 [Saprolegnia diclina VS20]